VETTSFVNEETDEVYVPPHPTRVGDDGVAHPRPQSGHELTQEVADEH